MRDADPGSRVGMSVRGGVDDAVVGAGLRASESLRMAVVAVAELLVVWVAARAPKV